MSKPNPLSGTNGQLMVMAAHRYCLGRQSYIVGSCCEWLRHNWPLFNENTQRVILRDTVEALQDGLAGAECDTRNWLDFGNWAWQQLSHEPKCWVADAVAHRGKPWPLEVNV